MTSCLKLRLPLAAAASVFGFVMQAMGQFAPGGATISTTVTGQTLSANTGTITSSGAISITSNGVALVMTGTSSLINNGTIQTTGTGRAIDSNSGVANLTVTNTGLISGVATDAFRVNTDSAVSLINSGTIRVTAGGQAIDWAAITTRSNSLNNQSGGVISAVGEDAVRPGTNGIVMNAGLIAATPTGTTSPSGSDGIDVRTFSGIQITNTGTVRGRHGIATDGSNISSSITINNNTGGIIEAVNGSGINIDGVSVNVTANLTNQSGATIRGGVIVTAIEGDGDGIDVDGVLTLNNSGDVMGLGARGATNNAEGIAAGGGNIINTATGRIIGSSLTADAPNGDSSRGGNGILIDNSSGGNAIAATTVTNSGLIEGRSGFGIRIVGNFADEITNNATGTIRGTGSSAAIQTGGGADVLTNRGAIIGTGANAIDLGDGDDTLLLLGSAASVIGDVSGGTGSNATTIDPGTGNLFSLTGALSNFDFVNVQSGIVQFSGANSYSGLTRLNGGVLELIGANRVAAASGLVLNGGTLALSGIGAANGQTFTSLALSANSAIDLNFTTSLTFMGLGNLSGNFTLTVMDYLNSISPNYAFRVLGDVTGNASFLSLLGRTTINGTSVTYLFDGTYTNVAPVPEPSTFGLLALGGLAALAYRRKR